MLDRALNVRPARRQVLPRQFTPTTLAQAALDPAVAMTMLFASARAFNAAIDGAYLILALIVFSLTFPSIAAERTNADSLVGGVLTRWIVVMGLLLFIGWATRTLDLFDARVVAAWGLTTPFMLMGAKLVLPHVLAAEVAQRTAVIAGAGELGRNLAERIRNAPDRGIRFVGYFDDRGPDRTSGAGPRQALGSLNDLPAFVKERRIDLIYITLPMASQPRLLSVLAALHDTTASIYFVPDIFLFDLIQARMDTIDGMPVIAVCESPFYGVNGLVKLALDVVVAALFLVLASPAMLAIAVAIKLESRGPVLFRQRRYGVDGREIVVYKFRTMRVCEDGEVIRQATHGDSRVTRLGALLRHTSLDELPQFINVLQGRMSVVGPRPHAVAHNELYRKLIKGYMIRHKVKPGITGLAQVSGCRGETETVEKMRARIEYDLAYLRSWSLALDLRIMLWTIPVVLFGRNTY